MKLAIDKRWRVIAEGWVDVPLPATVVWGQMRDYRRFLVIDPLHAGVRVVEPGRAGPRGDRLIISHRLLGLGPDRFGRVLRWREGRGYAISDLSARGMRSGFPHVCTYEIAATGPGRSRLTVGARGLWTARAIPRWVAKAWLWWVLKGTEARIRIELERHAAWRARAGLPTGTRP